MNSYIRFGLVGAIFSIGCVSTPSYDTGNDTDASASTGRDAGDDGKPEAASDAAPDAVAEASADGDAQTEQDARDAEQDGDAGDDAPVGQDADAATDVTAPDDATVDAARDGVEEAQTDAGGDAEGAGEAAADACADAGYQPGPSPHICARATDDECDGTVDVNPSLPNGQYGNGFDDDCDGKVDEGCECSPGTSKNCALVPSNQIDPGGLPVGWCASHSLGSMTCPVTNKWDGTCSGALPPQAEQCAVGDFDCDGLNSNPDGVNCSCVDTGFDAGATDAGAGDAMDEWDGYIPVCIDGVKDCQGKQPVICQGGQWVNNGAPCAWKCGQSAVEPNVCFDSGRHTSAGPNGVNSDPITLDNATGLKWAGFSTPGDYAQQSVACTNMNPTWTTPTLAQLQTLLTQPFPVAAGVTQNNVDGMASGFSGWIWSSTKFDSGHGWGMNMETGAAELHYLYETSLNFGLLCLVP